MLQSVLIIPILLVLGLSTQLCIGQYGDTRIVNGTDALPGEFPYAVSLRYNQSHECGGSIIGNKWVLTAAHCIYLEFLDILTVLYGSVYLFNNITPQSFIADVSNAYVHENYLNYGGYENDIGLIELKEYLTFSRYVQSINLPPFMAETPTGKKAVLIGWGYPETDREVVMEVLQTVTIIVFPENVCTSFHEELFNSTVHICAGIQGGGKGQCTGDSGGPLTINSTQYGIVSWSDKPCTITPGVLTRVAAYREWIFEKTGL